MFSKEFLEWIKPVLNKREYKILVRHGCFKRKDIRIHSRDTVMREYHLSRKEFNKLVWKLNLLMILYELQVAAGLVQ